MQMGKNAQKWKRSFTGVRNLTYVLLFHFKANKYWLGKMNRVLHRLICDGLGAGRNCKAVWWGVPDLYVSSCGLIGLIDHAVEKCQWTPVLPPLMSPSASRHAPDGVASASFFTALLLRRPATQLCLGYWWCVALQLAIMLRPRDSHKSLGFVTHRHTPLQPISTAPTPTLYSDISVCASVSFSKISK